MGCQCRRSSSDNGRSEKVKEITAYVDGSYEPSVNRYAFGCVLIEAGETVDTLSGSGNDPEVAKIRNVAGEMLGAMNAVKWAKARAYEKITIFYDYSGIEMWATGGWKAKNEYTKGYADYMKKSRESIKICFEKVKAHTGITFNEMADKLAKAALSTDCDDLK